MKDVPETTCLFHERPVAKIKENIYLSNSANELNKRRKVMKNLTHLITWSLLATVMLGFVTKVAVAQDVVKVAPEAYKVLFVNDRVRVLEYRIKPGEKDAMHSHSAYLVYPFGSAKVKVTFP